jgi:hypothetical protein
MKKQLLYILFACLSSYYTIGQNFAIHGDIAHPRQRLTTLEDETSSHSFFSTTATLRPIGISIRISEHYWLTGAYSKHKEFIQYANNKINAVGESILSSVNYYGGFYGDFKLWRWISIQPEVLLNVVNYQLTWTPQPISFIGYNNANFDKIIAKTTEINPGRRFQPCSYLRLVVKPVKRISLHLGIGYSLGTKKLQEWTVVYYKNNIVQKEVKTWIFGSKLIPTFGVALLFGKIQ